MEAVSGHLSYPEVCQLRGFLLLLLLNLIAILFGHWRYLLLSQTKKTIIIWKIKFISTFKRNLSCLKIRMYETVDYV